MTPEQWEAVKKRVHEIVDAHVGAYGLDSDFVFLAFVAIGEMEIRGIEGKDLLFGVVGKKV